MTSPFFRRLQLLVSLERMVSNTYTTFVNSLTDEKLVDKFDTADKSKLETVDNETIKQFDAAQEGLEEEYKEKQGSEAIAK